MSLAAVKAEYEQEKKVLEAWMTRMDISTPVTEVPPENAMSTEYKEGWTVYLTAVLSISTRMITVCAQAEQNKGDTTALKQILNKEAVDYDALAAEAKNRNLTELYTMLTHEAKSRRDIVAEL